MVGKHGLGWALAVAGVAVAGCGAAPTSPQDGVEGPVPDPAERTAVAGDSATVALGGTVVFERAGLTLTYLALESDSRCPVGVTCVWEGDAEVRVRARRGGDAVEVSLHTTLEPRAVRVDGLEVTLVDVLPRPVYGEEMDPAETRIVVRVR